ncbi:hypothetical protein BDV97DRAFT_369789 [Delphinella strobiligena]|nr:hypothetical protein BDV97DRAFT_369789 [Delphinella strobiligena]
MSDQNPEEQEDLFDILHSRIPVPEENSPTIATGQFALERRVSSRRGSPLDRRTATKSPTSDHGIRISTPSSLSVDNGIRSAASSPGPSRIDTGMRKRPPPPIKAKQMRPRSELFLPTQVSTKRMTFNLPKMHTPMIEDFEFGFTPVTSPYELFLPTPPGASKRMTSVKVPKAVPEEGEMEDEVEEPESPDEPPMSPISSALAKARFSRLDVHNSVRHMMNNVSTLAPHQPAFHERAISAPFGLERPSTAPPSLTRRLSISTLKSTRSLPYTSSIRATGGSSRGAGIKPLSSTFRKRGSAYSGIDKDVTAMKRTLAAKSRLTTLTTNTSNSITSTDVVEGSIFAEGPASPLSPTVPAVRKPTTSVLPWRRRKRGETMSMLLDAGFFPVNEYIYNPSPSSTPTSADKKTPSTLRTKKRKLALSILVKDMPPNSSPLSIVGTPKEFYGLGGMRSPTSPHRHIRASTNRRSFGPRRRIMGQLKTEDVGRSRQSIIIANALALSPLTPSPQSPTTPSAPGSTFITLSLPRSPISPSSPGVLEVIPEHGSEVTDEAPPQRIVILEINNPTLVTEEPADLPREVPVKTEIHLSSGTVVTVVPPELTAYTAHTYIQGPIVIQPPFQLQPAVPRKDSLASLEPFQDAVEAIYDQTLAVNGNERRVSEDHTGEDLGLWLDGWGFRAPICAFDDFTTAGAETSDHADDEDSIAQTLQKRRIEQLLGLNMDTTTGHAPPRHLDTNNGSLDEHDYPGHRYSSSSAFYHAHLRNGSLPTSRKSSTNTTTISRKGSGQTLTTLLEDEVLDDIPDESPSPSASPTPPVFVMSLERPTDLARKEDHIIVTKEASSAIPDTQIEEAKISFDWDSPISTTSWRYHSEVREIARSGSTGTAVTTESTERNISTAESVLIPEGKRKSSAHTTKSRGSVHEAPDIDGRDSIDVLGAFGAATGISIGGAKIKEKKNKEKSEKAEKKKTKAVKSDRKNKDKTRDDKDEQAQDETTEMVEEERMENVEKKVKKMSRGWGRFVPSASGGGAPALL